MTGLVGRIVCTLIASACLAVPPAHAQNAKAVPGEYCLVGVRAIGSCMRFSPGGKWEYFLSYGAYDERSEGTWKAANGGVVVNSPPYDQRATFSFKRLQKSDSGAYTVLVVGKGGDRGIAGVDVVVTCGGATKGGYTQYYGLEVDCAQAPTAVALSLRMFGLAPQSIDVASQAGADKGYVFEFDRRFGKKKFVAHRVRVGRRIADNACQSVIENSPGSNSVTRRSRRR